MFQNFKNLIRHGKQVNSKSSKSKEQTGGSTAASEGSSHSHPIEHTEKRSAKTSVNQAAEEANSAKRSTSYKRNKYDNAVKRIIAEENEVKSKRPTYPGLEKYEILEKMGDGAFSFVYKAKDLETGEYRAIKVVSKHKLSSSQRASVLKEAAIMRQLDHPSIVHMYAFIETDENYFIILELVDGGELFHQIVRLTYFSEDLSRHVILQVANAIRYLHEEAGVVHRDIKPENLLFTPGPYVPSNKKVVRPGDDDNKEDEGDFLPGVGGGGIATIKLADFGLSKVIWDSKTMTPCGTVGYTAPEIVKDERYSKSVDMWAFGCVLYTILCGFPPFFDESIEVLTRKVAKGEYAFLSPWWDGISDSAKDLVSRLLTVDPKQRYTIEDFFQHPWVTQSDTKIKRTREFRAHLPTASTPSTPMHERGVRDLAISGAWKDAFDVSNAVYRLEQETAVKNKAARKQAIIEEEEEEDGGRSEHIEHSLGNLTISREGENNQSDRTDNSSHHNVSSPNADSYFDLHLEGATLLERRKAKQAASHTQ